MYVAAVVDTKLYILQPFEAIPVVRSAEFILLCNNYCEFKFIPMCM